MAAIGEQTERRWAGAGIEPSLEEIMGDPIVHLVMRRDGLTLAEVWRIIADFQTGPQGDGRLLRSSDPAAPEAEAASLRRRQGGLTSAH